MDNFFYPSIIAKKGGKYKHFDLFLQNSPIFHRGIRVWKEMWKKLLSSGKRGQTFWEQEEGRRLVTEKSRKKGVIPKILGSGEKVCPSFLFEVEK